MAQVKPDIADLYEWFEFNEESGNRTGIHAGWLLEDNNTVLFGAGIKGNAADFEEDTDEFLMGDDPTDFDPGNTDWTIVDWVKVESQSASLCILARYRYSGEDERVFYLTLNSTNSYHPRFVVSSDGTYNLGVTSQLVDWGAALNNGQWYMITIQHDSVNNKIRIKVGTDAWVEAEWAGGVHLSNVAKLQFGAYDHSNTLDYDGLQDEPSFWSVCLTEDNIEWLENSGSGRTYSELIISIKPDKGDLLEWFEFNEESGNRTGVHAGWVVEDNNTVLFDTGIKGNAADFEDDNDEFLLGDTPLDFNPGNIDWTVVIWIKPESQTEAKYILSRWREFEGADHRVFRLYLQAGSYEPVFFVSSDGKLPESGNFKSITWGSALDNGTWYMLTIQHDSVNNKIRMKVGTSAWIEAVWTVGINTSNVAKLQFGGYDHRGDFTFDGLQDEPSFWDVCLTEANIAWLFNSDIGRTYSELAEEVAIRILRTRRGIDLLGRHGRRLKF